MPSSSNNSVSNQVLGDLKEKYESEINSIQI